MMPGSRNPSAAGFVETRYKARMLASLRWVSLGIWLTLLAIAFVGSPAASPDQNAMIVKMLTFRLDGVNLSLFALFNLMGVWPMVFIVLLAFDTTEQRVWRWPFVLGSFALGAFALLPYLVLRKWGAQKRVADKAWLQALGSRWAAGFLLSAALALSFMFFASGDLEGFAKLFQHDQFTFVMSFDFIACSAAGVLLSLEDAAVRATSPSGLWSLGGAVGAAYRLVRSPLGR